MKRTTSRLPYWNFAQMKRYMGNIVVLCIAAVTSSAAYAQNNTHGGPAKQAPAVEVTLEAPDFELPGINGKIVRLADYKGKSVLLNFWATWCVPCKLEMPWFMEFQKKYAPQGLAIIGIAIDDPDAVQKFAQKLGVNYRILLGTRAVFDAYSNVGMLGLPTTFYIDPRGKIMMQSSGSVSRSEIESEIKFVLAKSSAASDRSNKSSQPRPSGQL
jgi:peroxiredoxin